MEEANDIIVKEVFDKAQEKAIKFCEKYCTLVLDSLEELDFNSGEAALLALGVSMYGLQTVFEGIRDAKVNDEIHITPSNTEKVINYIKACMINIIILLDSHPGSYKFFDLSNNDEEGIKSKKIREAMDKLFSGWLKDGKNK